MAKTALVTGATDGVGRVVAKALGKDGWRVLAHGRDKARGESLVKEIEQAGGQATFLPADLASLAEARRLAGEVRKATDRLELLINNKTIGVGEAVKVGENFGLRLTQIGDVKQVIASMGGRK